ncbi:MAG: DUF4339 domain-containing protein [Akkermansiaceae bacterium]|nr:DUF4339 domain-containing protein [Akkermansiaceae bacterium]
MSEWYYAKAGQQMGPVPLSKLKELLESGGIDPQKDLVWTSSMKDWLPAAQVEGLGKPTAAPVADPSNPYAAPQTGWNEAAELSTAAGELAEIVPGSQPFDAAACIKRGWELTKRNVATIVLTGLVYVGIMMGVGMVIGVIGFLVMGGSQFQIDPETRQLTQEVAPAWFQILNQLITQLVTTFLSLGATRIALNIVSGREATVGMLFGEGSKLLKAFGASILFGLMVAIGFLLLIVPGVYLALRFGQYMTAIVDKDLGVIDSFKYSSSITTNNRVNLFVLALFGFLLTIAGLLACIVGVFVVLPIIWLAAVVAYRWMQYGNKAAMDHPGTAIPMLAPRA